MRRAACWPPLRPPGLSWRHGWPDALEAGRRACGYLQCLSQILSDVDQTRGARPAQVRGARSHPARVSQATYWRRRITVLGAAAGLLTALSWAVNGMLTARSTAGQAAPAGSTGGAGPPPPPHSGFPAGQAPPPPPPPPSRAPPPPP